MRLLEFIGRFGRKSKGRAPEYAPLPHHPGLSVPAPDRPVPDRQRRGRLCVRGKVVADYDVLPAYPDAVTRDYIVFDWSKDQSDQDRTMGIFEVPGGIVSRGYVAVDPGNGYLFINHTYDSFPIIAGSAPALGQTFQLSAAAVCEISGRVVVVGGPFETNYFHGLFSWFSRLVMLDQMAPHLGADPSTRYLVDRRAQQEPFASVIAALGLTTDRIIWSDPATDYRIEHAVFVSFLHEGLLCPEVIRLTAGMIRNALAIDDSRPGWRRLWISREHFSDPRRRINNIDEIAPLLDRHGFERVTLENLSFGEQVKLFSEAEIVAGSHGAGFSNIIFCPTNARIVLIEKEFTRFTGIAKLFLNLASISGLQAEIVPAASVHEPGTDYANFLNLHFADAIVEAGAFASALDRATA